MFLKLGAYESLDKSLHEPCLQKDINKSKNIHYLCSTSIWNMILNHNLNHFIFMFLYVIKIKFYWTFVLRILRLYFDLHILCLKLNLIIFCHNLSWILCTLKILFAFKMFVLVITTLYFTTYRQLNSILKGHDNMQAMKMMWMSYKARR